MGMGIGGALEAIRRIEGRIDAIEQRLQFKTQPPEAFTDAIRRAESRHGVAPGDRHPTPDRVSLGPASAPASSPPGPGGAAAAPLSATPASGGTSAYAADIQAAAQRHGVDPALVRAVVAAESGGNPRATSQAGAMGLMQLMPGTARSLGVADAYDPKQNLEGGTRYLADLTEKFGLEQGLAAYNAGPGNVARYGGVPPFRETRHYVDRVMKLYGQFSEEQS